MRRVRVVQYHLSRAVRHRPDEIRDRLPELPGRCEDFFAVRDRAVVAEDHRAHRHPLGRRQKRCVRLGLIGQRGAEIAVEAQHVTGLVQ